MKNNDLEGKWGDKSNWNGVIDWYVQNMVSFYNAVNPIWEKVQGKLD